MHLLHTYLNKYASTFISDEDFESIKSHFIHKEFKKKHSFLKEGETCKYFAFILKGAMYQYYVDEKGKEHVVNFYTENWWAGDRESFVMDTPTIYNIEAWEDSEVLLLSRESTLLLTNKFQAFNEFILKLDEKNKIAIQKRITCSISANAERRYAEFTNDYPSFLVRFPQHMVASYLGITKETLSRIRNQMHRK